MEPLHLKQLNAARQSRKGAILVTNLQDGRDRLILKGDDVVGELGQNVAQVFQSGIARQIDINGVPFFLNPYLPSIRIVVIGAVHITKALVPMAQLAEFDISIIDPRTAFASEKRFENVPLFPQWPDEYFETEPLDDYCALVALTHDPKIDDPALIAALKARCCYIGALGSRKTHAKRVLRLQDAGFDNDSIERIHAPIGLDIGAASPAEIAVSVLAQIIAVLRRR